MRNYVTRRDRKIVQVNRNLFQFFSPRLIDEWPQRTSHTVCTIQKLSWHCVVVSLWNSTNIGASERTERSGMERCRLATEGDVGSTVLQRARNFNVALVEDGARRDVEAALLRPVAARDGARERD